MTEGLCGASFWIACGAKSSLSFKARGDAFCLSQPSRGEHPRLTHEVTIAVASLLIVAVPRSPALLGSSLFREARPFASTMA
jgi:hypothetical protein